MLGLTDAARDPVSVRFTARLVVPVASIAGQALLKVLAWEDRRRAKPRHDALDLAMLLRSDSADAALDDLYERGLPMLEATGHDVELAIASLPGTDVRALAGARALAAVRRVLERESRLGILYIDMTGDPDANRRLVDSFRVGIGESND